MDGQDSTTGLILEVAFLTSPKSSDEDESSPFPPNASESAFSPGHNWHFLEVGGE